MSLHWLRLCPVEVTPLAHWLQGASGWSTPATPDKPTRIFEPALPPELLQPVYDAVLSCFGRPVRTMEPMLSRMRPGQSHAYHVDPQTGDWITRVHVPVATNPEAWLMFEEEDQRVHFECGRAYTFNALARHSFGNDGATDRVHLIFDVVRGG